MYQPARFICLNYVKISQFVISYLTFLQFHSPKVGKRTRYSQHQCLTFFHVVKLGILCMSVRKCPPPWFKCLLRLCDKNRAVRTGGQRGDRPYSRPPPNLDLYPKPIQIRGARLDKPSLYNLSPPLDFETFLRPWKISRVIELSDERNGNCNFYKII